MKAEDKPKAGQLEVETRRIGLQDELKEKVVEVIPEDKECQKRALKAIQATQGRE